MSSSSRLLDITPELLVYITRFLAFTDRLQLASTSSDVRHLLGPDLFSTVRFTNRQRDVTDFSHVISKFGNDIQGLYFECYLYPNLNVKGDEDDPHEDSQTNDDDYNEEQQCSLPDEAIKILSGQSLSHVDTITVMFFPENNFDGSNWGDRFDFGTQYIHEEPEDEDEIQKSEGSHRWRKVISQVWHALSKNSVILDLRIFQLIPREASSWHTPQWKVFLSQLRKLSINLWGADGSAHACSNTTPGYMDFLSRLDEYFFDHTSQLLHLEILADAFSPYGCEGDLHAPIALHPRHCPNLQTLNLENCAIDPNLVKFLESHAKVLKNLSLTECTSFLDDNFTENAISWEEFFKLVCASKPVLEVLRVINSRISLTSEEASAQFERQEAPGRREIYQPPVHEGTRKLFSYTENEDEFGTTWALEGTNVERFEMGMDQEEYDNLMSIVNKNATHAI